MQEDGPSPLSGQLTDAELRAHIDELEKFLFMDGDLNTSMTGLHNLEPTTEPQNDGTHTEREDSYENPNEPSPSYNTQDLVPLDLGHGAITARDLGQGAMRCTQNDQSPGVGCPKSSGDSATTPEMIASSELGKSIMPLATNVDDLVEEESLFVSDAHNIDVSQPAESRRLEGNICLQQVSTEAEDHITAPTSDPDASKDAELDSAKMSKTPRTKAAPLAKTAKEWFAKSLKHSQPFLSEIMDMKRKRTKGDDKAGTSRARKRSKKFATDKGAKKKPQKRRSIKVMTAMFESLRDLNPIEARIALGDLPQVDPIIASTKGSQLQQIMKSAPKDADPRAIAVDLKTIDMATRSFGYGNCVAKNGKWLITGMTTSLHGHQVIGVSWMLGREFCNEGPRGGILGDQMGLGKTMQTLATIVTNIPTEDDLETYSKTTLIVAPATAIKQWEEEIRKHTDKKYIGTILHYKQTKELELETLTTFGIILVSYQEISRQFPSKNLRSELQIDLASLEERKEKFDDYLGPLFKMNFWRIVLDEAHQIKNKNSQMSVSCQNLCGRHRWGLSGTPVTNNRDELYPYLRFLKADWVGSPQDFQYFYDGPEGSDSEKRLSLLVTTLMLRRTMKDKFMGRPLYDIPMSHVSVRRVRLTGEERVIYNVVEACFREIINKVLRRLRKVQWRDVSMCLVFLLRLRQGAAHPFLLEPVFKEVLDVPDLLQIQRGLRDAGSTTPVFKQIGKWCGKAAATRRDTANEQDRDGPQEPFGKSQFGYEFNMERQVNIAIESQRDDVCRLCYQEPVNARIAECDHVFCHECLENHIIEERKGGRIVPKCPDCNKSLSNYELFEQSDAEYSDIESLAGEASSQSNKSLVGKLGRDNFGKHPKLRKSQSRFLRECDQAYPKPVVPSAKTIAVKDAILQWQSEAPDDKIIIFMEFKMTGAIIGRMLQAEGIKFLYFFGDMSYKARQHAIRAFHEEKDIKVMIASLKCGSVALNLTCANRVILIDLWWNVAIEYQAFARVFRIGQTKETHFLRIIAQNTTDNRLEALQEQKVKNISKVLEPGPRIQLSVEEIVSLFGNVQKSEDGRFEIVPDYKSDAELAEEFEEAEEVEEP
ncbi:hypothetical protein NUW58_g6270 [Xylaria curta]|uniref:Uncharacterized protein n=1 Tax=Xylaria curta TaxID=42375 RepID=A0ACC1NW88_9PEZI|nr:hypothetical protein NUW58_g6270 [Xylaria curta]